MRRKHLRDHEGIADHHLVFAEQAELRLLLGEVDGVAAEDRDIKSLGRVRAEFGDLGAEIRRSGRGKQNFADRAALRLDQRLELLRRVAAGRIVDGDDVPGLDALVLQERRRPRS